MRSVFIFPSEAMLELAIDAEAGFQVTRPRERRRSLPTSLILRKDKDEAVRGRRGGCGGLLRGDLGKIFSGAQTPEEGVAMCTALGTEGFVVA